jgi:hypothetical protein
MPIGGLLSVGTLGGRSIAPVQCLQRRKIFVDPR